MSIVVFTLSSSLTGEFIGNGFWKFPNRIGKVSPVAIFLEYNFWKFILNGIPTPFTNSTFSLGFVSRTSPFEFAAPNIERFMVSEVIGNVWDPKSPITCLNSISLIVKEYFNLSFLPNWSPAW